MGRFAIAIGSCFENAKQPGHSFSVIRPRGASRARRGDLQAREAWLAECPWSLFEKVCPVIAGFSKHHHGAPVGLSQVQRTEGGGPTWKSVIRKEHIGCEGS